MSTILQKIELLMFNNLISDNSIIEDDGTYNIPMENHNNQRYSYVDDKEYGQRTEIEQKKILFLNDVMDIFSDLHQYIHENEPDNAPIYFNRVELTKKMEDLLSVNIDEETIDGDSCEEVESVTNKPKEEQTIEQTLEQTLEQITDDVVEMEL